MIIPAKALKYIHPIYCGNPTHYFPWPRSIHDLARILPAPYLVILRAFMRHTPYCMYLTLWNVTQEVFHTHVTLTGINKPKHYTFGITYAHDEHLPEVLALHFSHYREGQRYSGYHNYVYFNNRVYFYGGNHIEYDETLLHHTLYKEDRSQYLEYFLQHNTSVPPRQVPMYFKRLPQYPILAEPKWYLESTLPKDYLWTPRPGQEPPLERNWEAI